MTSSARNLGAGLEAPPGYEDETDDEQADEDETELGEPTVYFSMTGGGHDYVSPTSPHDPEGEFPMYVHRLTAWAWDVLESPFFAEDAREVHHHVPEAWVGDDPVPKGGIPWFTAEDHLLAERPDDHATKYHFTGGRQ